MHAFHLFSIQTGLGWDGVAFTAKDQEDLIPVLAHEVSAVRRAVPEEKFTLVRAHMTPVCTAMHVIRAHYLGGGWENHGRTLAVTRVDTTGINGDVKMELRFEDVEVVIYQWSHYRGAWTEALRTNIMIAANSIIEGRW